jgi:hypothetical protein
VEAFFSKFAVLQQPPFHPKWKEVAVNALLPGWSRFRPAQERLDQNGNTPAGFDMRHKFDQFLSADQVGSSALPKLMTTCSSNSSNGGRNERIHVEVASGRRRGGRWPPAARRSFVAACSLGDHGVRNGPSPFVMNLVPSSCVTVARAGPSRHRSTRIFSLVPLHSGFDGLNPASK